MARRVAVAPPVPAFDANDWANCTLWADWTDQAAVFQNSAGTTAITGNDQPIQSVINKGANAPGNARFVGGGSNDVRWIEGLVNGKAGARCNAVISSTTRTYVENSTSHRAPSNFITASSGTMFCLVRPNFTMRTNATEYLWTGMFHHDGQFVGLYVGQLTSGNPRGAAYAWDGNKDIAGAALTPADWQVLTWRHLSGNLSFRINKGSWVTVASGNTQGLTGNSLQIFAGASLEIASGQSLSALHHVIYSDGKSDSDCDAIIDALMAEAGL